MTSALFQLTINWIRKHPTLGRLALNLLPDIKWHIRIPSIGQFLIRLRRHRSFWIRHPFTHETFPFAALQRLVLPGEVVYDVGANIGLYLRFLFTHCHAGKVYAFEPMTENRALLLKNIELGKVTDKATVFPVALSDSEGNEKLQIDDLMSGSAALDRITKGAPSLGRLKYGMSALTELVATTRIDTLLKDESIQRPHCIKIDVEGAELLVLQGAIHTLEKYRPKLLIELHGVEMGREVFHLLNNIGYHCYSPLAEGNVRQYQKVTTEKVGVISNYYDFHFLVASMDESDLKKEILPLQLSPNE